MGKYWLFKDKPVDIGKMEPFIAAYNAAYYMGNPQIVPNAKQSSEFVEKQIDALLEGVRNGKRVLSFNDVIHILAWKFGRIDHKKSEKEKWFFYREDWECIEDKFIDRLIDEEKNKITVPRPKKGDKTAHFSIGSIAQFISKNFEVLHKESPKQFLSHKEIDIYGMGPVYKITLLYFVSGGRYPIYDRFAYKALLALGEGTNPGLNKRAPSLPEKSDTMLWNNYVEKLDNSYQKYIELMEIIFNKDYIEDRRIDRALWVYGHLFHDNMPAIKQ